MEADDSILEHTKARLPWLVLALEVLSPKVLGLFEALCLSMENYSFTPYCCNGRNVGVQSSAIIVQGLANNTLSGSLFNRLVKEVSLSLLNGVIWPLYYLWKSLSSRRQNGHWVIVTTALVSVIIIASLIGTFVPLLLINLESILH
jgi:magnesium transporter